MKIDERQSASTLGTRPALPLDRWEGRQDGQIDMASALASVLGTTRRPDHRNGAVQSAVSVPVGCPIRLSEVER
jgi:hypothetical protein